MVKLAVDFGVAPRFRRQFPVGARPVLPGEVVEAIPLFVEKGEPNFGLEDVTVPATPGDLIVLRNGKAYTCSRDVFNQFFAPSAEIPPSTYRYYGPAMPPAGTDRRQFHTNEYVYLGPLVAAVQNFEAEAELDGVGEQPLPVPVKAYVFQMDPAEPVRVSDDCEFKSDMARVAADGTIICSIEEPIGDQATKVIRCLADDLDPRTRESVERHLVHIREIRDDLVRQIERDKANGLSSTWQVSKAHLLDATLNLNPHETDVISDEEAARRLETPRADRAEGDGAPPDPAAITSASIPELISAALARRVAPPAAVGPVPEMPAAGEPTGQPADLVTAPDGEGWEDWTPDETTVPEAQAAAPAAPAAPVAPAPRPWFRRIDQDPMYRQENIRRMARPVFARFGAEDMEGVQMTSGAYDEMLAWAKASGTEVAEVRGEAVFPAMPNYLPEIGVYDVEGMRLMFVKDHAGSYTYAWPSPMPQPEEAPALPAPGM